MLFSVATPMFLSNDISEEIELDELPQKFETGGAPKIPMMITDVNAGQSSGFKSNTLDQATVFGNELYFRGDDGINGHELWKTDGTESGTVMVKDIKTTGDSWPSKLTVVGSTLFFQATDGNNGYELWKSDGTTAGTVMVMDINNGSNDSNPNGLTAMGGYLYFMANDGTNGYELWMSDGNGTVMVKDIS